MAELPVEPMLDFILHPEEAKGETFSAYVARHKGQPMELVFYNIASQTTWKGQVVPREWQGTGLLGVNIREEDYTVAHTRPIRVLDYFVGSPFHIAGFKPHVDYILGTSLGPFADLEEFQDLVASHDHQPLDLLVYNTEDCAVRVLTLTPNSLWGGAGSLGGELGFGFFHSLPIRTSKPKYIERLLDSPTNRSVVTPNSPSRASDIPKSSTDNMCPATGNAFDSPSAAEPICLDEPQQDSIMPDNSEQIII